MCGIAGFLTSGFSPARGRAEVAAMTAALRHRGPDDEGVWLDPAAGVALGHRRLSIIDLSPLGAQPMRSRSGRFAITFNGEIYNFHALRAELTARGVSFRSGSDTEVLLAAIEEWGLVRALERSRGMFAFGLWDAGERTLWLARDRFGEKPLYYGQLGDTFVFGSELKALRAHSKWRGDVDRDALSLLLQLQYIPAPRSIFRGVRKVSPGSLLRVRTRNGAPQLEETRYFEPSQIAASDLPPPAESEALVEEVGATLAEAVRLQMVADVPVGAFLSGGIDSSLIVALMQQAAAQPVRTFSIGFHEAAFDETPYARQVAQHLGTCHTELMVTPRDALAVIPRLPSLYDEPFADASQIPTSIVCALARRDVTVALSGDAGDELFGGYQRYLLAAERWERLKRSSNAWRRTAARTLLNLPTGVLAPLAPAFRIASRGRLRSPQRLKERAHTWAADSFCQLYDAMISFWQPSEHVVIGASAVNACEPNTLSGADPLAHMMYTDVRRYLTDDNLVKVDRAAMAVSLETRVPLLDVAVARAAWRIPTALHIRDGRGKWVLRRLLERHLPRPLFERPKGGFAVPIAGWLRGELREWAEELLRPARLTHEGYFSAPLVHGRWRQHLQGEADWSAHLWSVLMFQAWHQDLVSRCSLQSAPSAA